METDATGDRSFITRRYFAWRHSHRTAAEVSKQDFESIYRAAASDTMIAMAKASPQIELMRRFIDLIDRTDPVTRGPTEP